jgi:hypothetical protein
MSRTRVIAVDFDETLVDYTADGEPVPMPGAADAMAELRAKGFHLVVHTCRTTIARENGTLPEELGFIADTLDAFGIVFDEIWEGDKMIADLYIDDRAIPFRGDWDDVVQRVRGRGKAG